MADVLMIKYIARILYINPFAKYEYHHCFIDDLVKKKLRLCHDMMA